MYHLIWNVDPAIVSFGPFAVRWYGLLFALGFLVGFQVMAQIYRAEQRPLENLSSLLSYVMLGTIIGARLGHVLFYQPDYYVARPWEILPCTETRGQAPSEDGTEAGHIAAPRKCDIVRGSL